MSVDTRLDQWLDQHPRLDSLYTEIHIQFWSRVRTVRELLDLRARRDFARWAPGITYLDHGYEPCALVEKDPYGTLVGVSLVDGRLIGGCSIYHCGPEIVPLAEARAIADMLTRMRRDRGG